MRPSFIDPALQRQLEEVGYVVVRLMEESEARQILGEIQDLRPADRFRPDGSQGLNRASYHCTFLDVSTEYKRQLDDLTRRVFGGGRLASILDRYALLTSNLYAKAPGLGRLEIHQNWPTTPDIRDSTFTVWCPFVDVGIDNGTIQVVPRSHKILPDLSTVTAEKYFIDFYEELIERWLEPITLQAGECLIFDDSLIHWSDSNRSEEFRWCIQAVFVPEEAQTVVYYFDADHRPPRFEVYGVDSSFYVDHGIEQLLARPTDLPLLGTIDYVNSPITEEEFVTALDLGPSTRALIYAGSPALEAFAAVLEALGREPASMEMEVAR